MTMRITVTLADEVVTALRRLADKHGITMTEALQRAVANERFIATLDEPEPVRWCKNCPFPAHLHVDAEDPEFRPPGCSGYEPAVPSTEDPK